MFTEIVASYSRKLNHSLYGGKSYETSDIFCSAKQETDKDPADAYNELFAFCRQAVETKVEEEITELRMKARQGKLGEQAL